MKRTLIVHVSEAPFRRAHRRAPRGVGSWAFCTVHPDRDDNYLDHVIWEHGDYSDARARAVAVARERNVATLYVCS